MTQCPKCGRAYAENFSYCLDDGTPLKHAAADEKTLIMPEPPKPTAPTPSPVHVTAPPRVATPTTTSSSNKAAFGVVALGVVGLFLVVIVWGAIKLAFWYLDRPQNTAQTTAPSVSPGASPSSNTDARGLLPGASPTTSSDAPLSEGLITPGVYECEVTRDIGADTKHTISIRLEVTVNVDGTYLSQGYVTIPTSNVRNLLGLEERGNYEQDGDVLILTNRRERELDFETGAWKGWKTPKDGRETREKIRNVTLNTYQFYDSDDDRWYTFTKI